jgi:hypothetical protein
MVGLDNGALMKFCKFLYWDQTRYKCRLAKTFGNLLHIGEGCPSSLNSWRKDVKERRKRMSAKVGRMLIEWDPSALFQECVQRVMREEGVSEEKAQKGCEESYDNQFEWEDFCSDLTEIIKKKNPNGFWHGTVINFGWRNQDGHKVFKAETGTEFLQSVLPKTECSFKITGNEWYHLIPISEIAFCKAV